MLDVFLPGCYIEEAKKVINEATKMMSFSGLVSNRGGVKILTAAGWDTVRKQKGSNKYSSVNFSLEENQMVYLDSYYTSPFAKKPMNGYFRLEEGAMVEVVAKKPMNGYFRLEEGAMVEVEYQEESPSNYLHEIYEELADPKGYEG